MTFSRTREGSAPSSGAADWDHPVIAVMADGVLVQDRAGAIVHCNPAAERILGVSRPRLLGRGTAWRTIRADGSEVPPSEHPAAVVARLGVPYEGVVLGVQRPDGRLVWVEASARPLGRRGRGGVVTVLADITDRLERERERTAVRHVAASVAAGGGPPRPLESLAEVAAHTTSAQAAAVVRIEPGSDRVRVMAAWPAARGPDPPPALMVPPDALVARVARSGEAQRDDMDGGEPVPVPPMPVDRVSSAAAAPILLGGGVWGVLIVASTRTALLPPDAVQRLEATAQLATLAAAAGDAGADVAARESMDPLTGLWNRRAFDDRLALELESARRYDRGIGVILLGLDGLLQINAIRTNEVGDRVLVEVASRLRAVARGGEVVARVGGDRFGVILTEASGVHAVVAAERLRAAVAVEPLPGAGRVSVSVGACATEDAPPGADLLLLAAVALHWAQAEGGGRVIRYSADAAVRPEPGEQERRLERARAFAGVRALARAVDARDPLTQRHSERVAELARSLARELGWAAERADRLHQAAIVHDVGKIAIPDAILFASRDLTAEERGRVQEHAALGAAIIQDALTPEQVDWVRGHHERFDGAGYPDGLAGTAIPDGARLLALADAWDAMTVTRPYGLPRSREDAWAECRSLRGSQFDPDAVAALGRVLASADGTGVRSGLSRAEAVPE